MVKVHFELTRERKKSCPNKKEKKKKTNEAFDRNRVVSHVL